MEEKWKSQEERPGSPARKLTLTESVVNNIHQNVEEGSAWESQDARIEKSDIIDKDDKVSGQSVVDAVLMLAQADGKSWDSYIYAACSGTAGEYTTYAGVGLRVLCAGGMMALFAGLAAASVAPMLTYRWCAGVPLSHSSKQSMVTISLTAGGPTYSSSVKPLPPRFFVLWWTLS